MRCIMVSYKRLWKLLIDKDMSKKELAEKAGRTIEQMNETELNELWKEAKK